MKKNKAYYSYPLNCKTCIAKIGMPLKPINAQANIKLSILIFGHLSRSLNGTLFLIHSFSLNTVGSKLIILIHLFFVIKKIINFLSFMLVETTMQS